MKARIYHQIVVRLFLSLVAMLSFVPIAAQDNNQHALYNYRNDGSFNAWLNIDIDSITYSRVDTLGVEHDDIVVQEVWTPDSLYRIPLEAIDSIGFRAPAPEFHDGLFYLRDYHASNTYAKDSLTIYFSPAILRDSLPAVGQTIVSMTDLSPYEHGFAGKVVGVTYNEDHIKVECTNAQINDIFKHFVFVGKVVGNEDPVSVPSEMKKAKGLEYYLPVKTYELPDINLSILNGILSVNSVKPKVTCYCLAYVDALFYQISADAFIRHDDISYTIKVNDDIIRRLDTETYGLLSELMTNEPFDKETAEEMEDKLLEAEWKKKISILDIPLGPVRLSIDFVPSFKMSGNVEASYQYSTKIKQHIGFETKNITIASMAALSQPGVAPFLLAADAFKNTTHTFVEDKSAANHKIGLTLDGSLSVGAALKLSVCLWADEVAHASVGGEAGLKMKGTIDFNLDTKDFDDDEEDMYNYPLWYGLTKDTKAEAELYAKVTGEIGITPSKFLTLKGSLEPESWKKELGTLYLFPHFTKPALPQSYVQGEWEYSPLTMMSIPSNDLLFSSKLGMVITDNTKDKRLFYTPAKEEYKNEEEWKKANDGLSISINNLSPGTYYCYPAFCLWGNKLWKAGPYTKIEVPEPLSISTQNVNVGIGESKTIYYTGGWEIIRSRVDDDDRSVVEVTDGDGYLVITGKKKGTAHITVEDKRSYYSVVLTVKVSDTYSLTLSTSTLELTPGSQGTVNVTSGSGSYDAVSNAKNVATVTVDGSKIIIEAVSPGPATITVKDNQTQERAKIEVTVSDGQGAITVTPLQIDYGKVEAGSYDFQRYVTISNSGEQERTVTIRLDNRKYWDLDLGSPNGWGGGGRDRESFTTKILPGGQTLVRLSFKPSNVGEYNCNLLVSSEELEGWVRTIPVKATYVEDPSFHLSSNSIDVYVNDYNVVRIHNGSGEYDIINDYPDIVEADINVPHVAHIPPKCDILRDISGEEVDIATDTWYITGKKVGHAVLKVKDKKTNEVLTLNVEVKRAPALSLSAQSVEVGVGETDSSIEIKSGSGWYDISIDSPEYATANRVYNDASWVDGNGVAHRGFFVEIQGLKAGNAKVTVKDNSSGETAVIQVKVRKGDDMASYLTCPDDNHPHLIDLGLPSGTKWACCNVDDDASKQSPTNYGSYYAWGEVKGKDSYYGDTYDYYQNGSYVNLGSDITGTQYDVAHVKWGGSWMMPSKEQQDELINNCTSTWTMQNGVSGRLFSGTNGGSIFLPAAGARVGSGLSYAGSNGRYWSSSQLPSDVDGAYGLHFNSGLASMVYYFRDDGLSVRPVSK